MTSRFELKPLVEQIIAKQEYKQRVIHIVLQRILIQHLIVRNTMFITTVCVIFLIKL